MNLEIVGAQEQILKQFNASWGTQYSSSSTLVKTGRELIRKSEAIQFERGIACGKLLRGTANFFLSSEESPLSDLLEAEQLFEKLGDTGGQSKALSVLGNVHENYGEFPEAIDACRKALNMMQQLGDKEGEGNVLGTLGNIYIHIQDFAAAARSVKRSLSIRTKLKNHFAAASSLNMLGRIFSLHKKFTESEAYYSQALALREKINDHAGIPWSYLGLASMSELKGDYTSAIHYYKQAIAISGKSGDRRNYLHCMLGLGKVYTKRKKPKDALPHLKEALKIGVSIGAKSIQTDIHLSMAQAYERLNDLPNALQHYKENYKLREEALNENTANRLRNQLINFAVEKHKKEAEIFRLRNVDLKEVLNRVKEEKKRSDDLLLNILPKKTAKELKKTGQAKARLHEEVSVLFADFKGFTEKSQKLSPQDLVAEIDEYFCAFDGIMEKYGIEKIKTIGDCYMAGSGLPDYHPMHTEKLLRAAFDVLNFVEEQKRKKGEKAYEVRLGIHTGPVVAGIVGRKKFAYDIWGDTVNTAKRMESAGEPGMINVSQTTCNLIDERFECVYRGEIEVKGKGKMKMYFVKGERDL